MGKTFERGSVYGGLDLLKLETHGIDTVVSIAEKYVTLSESGVLALRDWLNEHSPVEEKVKYDFKNNYFNREDAQSFLDGEQSNLWGFYASETPQGHDWWLAKHQTEGRAAIRDMIAQWDAENAEQVEEPFTPVIGKRHVQRNGEATLGVLEHDPRPANEYLFTITDGDGDKMFITRNGQIYTSEESEWDIVAVYEEPESDNALHKTIHDTAVQAITKMGVDEFKKCSFFGSNNPQTITITVPAGVTVDVKGVE